MAELIAPFLSAIQHIADPINFLFLVIAALAGMIIGVIPGLGGPIGMALLIPLTFILDPITAFMMFAGLKGGTNFGGSISAILINTPGTAPNAATLIDGYPMTRRGEGQRAIGISATASAVGALIGVVVLVLSVPVMLRIVRLFASPETFWLGMLGIVMVASILGSNVVPGLISGLLGLLVAMHGRNIFTGTLRWTYDVTILQDGVPLVPLFIGIFAIAEMIRLISEGGTIEEDPDGEDAVDESITEQGVADRIYTQWDGVRDVFRHKWLVLRSSIVGVVIGMIPGLGGVTANFLAYFQAVQTSDNRENFGKGDPRGVIAAEASNDAKDGGAFIPTLSLGIPGSATMAVLFGAFLLHGIQPGPRLLENNLDIVMIIVISLIISNILVSLTGLGMAKYFVYIARIDVHYIAPVIIFTALLGAYAINNVFMSVVVAMAFGIIGYVMLRIDMTRIPFVLAYVLEPIIEENFLRTYGMGQGDLTLFVQSTTSKVLFALVVVSLLTAVVDVRALLLSGRFDRWRD